MTLLKKLLSTANAPFSVLPYWVTLKYQIIKSTVLCSIFQQDCAKSAGVAQLAEHNVANVVVVGSNPITRSLNVEQRKNLDSAMGISGWAVSVIDN